MLVRHLSFGEADSLVAGPNQNYPKTEENSSQYYTADSQRVPLSSGFFSTHCQSSFALRFLPVI